jgi:anaerobic dimethyl sulfoxide reductase subunit A
LYVLKKERVIEMSKSKCDEVKQSRRQFLAAGAALTASAGLPLGVVSVASANEKAVPALQPGESLTWNACLTNCGSRCVLRAYSKEGKVVRIETDNTGDDVFGDHQIRACLRGRSMRKRIYSAERIQYPMKRVGKRGEGKFERISWDEALDTVAAALKKTIADYGNEAIHLLYGSGTYQLINGNQNASKRLLNLLGGYLDVYGTYSSAQVTMAMPFTYGDRPASYITEIANARLLVVFGNNFAVTRSSGGGMSYELTHALEKGRLRVIMIDPMYNDTMLGKESEWVPIRPGTDAALVEGIAYVLITEDMVDQAFLDKYCVGYDEKNLPKGAPKGSDYKSYILGKGTDKKAKTPQWASDITGIPVDTIVRIAREIGMTKPCYVTQGLGVQRYANGEQTARAIPMLPILTGNIGLPGTSPGTRGADSNLGEAGLPTGTNPVKTLISFFSWTDAIERGPELTALKDGVRNKDKLDVPIKFLWVTQSNTLINQHSDSGRTHKILQDDKKCEFILVVDNQMTPSARYADILLPDVTSFELWDLAADGYATGTLNFMVSIQPAHPPMFEARPLYDVCCDLAKRFGVEEKFSEGRTTEQWAEHLYNETRKKYPDQLPGYEEFKKRGVVRVVANRDRGIGLKAFREDPEKNALKTPSGKIEIYSSQLADIAKKWQLPKGDVITPLPQFVVTWESHLDPKAKQYPLQMIGFHTKGRTHSTYHNVDWLREVAPDEVWINPVDAGKRKIQVGDKVHVFNDRGTIEMAAKVTERIMPGVVGIPQGAWYRPDKRGVDVGGNVNTLTCIRPSPLAKANPQHTNLVEIKKV